MKISLLHQTDLFRPHNDPDDHFDLACVYALACQNQIDLKGILIDYPPDHKNGDPDVMSVGQMNFITGLNVPFAIGSNQPFKFHSKEKSVEAGAQFVIDILKKSKQPVAITIVGSCRDIAIAGKREPQLFAEKCAAIYLNAGTGSNEPIGERELEYNVGLDPAAFAAIFKIPCPVYWLPCFGEYRTSQSELRTLEFGTYFKFQQAEILPFLSEKMQKYFIFMLSKSNCPNWLRYLDQPKDDEAFSLFCQMNRNMWNTASFFHLAGKAVTKDGEIVDFQNKKKDAVFGFEPINVTCQESGVAKWNIDNNSKDRFFFHVLDLENYQSAMTKALLSLLETLP
jgi:hypothetical protein